MILLRIRKVRCSFFRPSAATSTSGSAWQIFARRPLRRATSGDRFPTAIHTAAFRLFIGTLPQAVVRSLHEPRDDTHKDRRKEQDPSGQLGGGPRASPIGAGTEAGLRRREA